MPGPAPSADRQPRPGRDIPWTDLPAGGRTGRAPAPPAHVTLAAAGKSWWAMAWKTPEATQWSDSELLTAARRAELEDLWQAEADSKLLAEMRHLEAQLCMTPKARKEARWRIVATVADPAAKPRKAAAKKKGRPKLRLVDPQAS